jgi:hypothetical protein
MELQSGSHGKQADEEKQMHDSLRVEVELR